MVGHRINSGVAIPFCCHCLKNLVFQTRTTVTHRGWVFWYILGEISNDQTRVSMLVLRGRQRHHGNESIFCWIPFMTSSGANSSWRGGEGGGPKAEGSEDSNPINPTTVLHAETLRRHSILILNMFNCVALLGAQQTDHIQHRNYWCTPPVTSSSNLDAAQKKIFNDNCLF